MESMKDAGMTTEELAEAISRFARAIPPLGEADIAMIRCNPSLSWLQKRRLIAKIKKQMRARREVRE